MAGSSYGTLFTVTTWGESHGPAIGVVIDGCPAGIPLSAEQIQVFLDRRKPGQSRFSTARKEADQVQILPAFSMGKQPEPLCPSWFPIPISDPMITAVSRTAIVRDTQTTPLTPNMAFAITEAAVGHPEEKPLTRRRRRCRIPSSRRTWDSPDHLPRSIGPVQVPASTYDYSCIHKNSLYMPNLEYAQAAEDYLKTCMEQQDSAGGVIECVITGLPAGIGEPVFEKLDARLAQAILSIGAVKGIEIGDGFAASASLGSSNNDAFYIEGNEVCKRTNHPAES